MLLNRFFRFKVGIVFFLYQFILFAGDDSFKINDLKLYSLKTKEKYINSFNTGIKVSAGYTDHYNKWLYSVIDLDFYAEKGSTSGLFIEKYEASSEINLKNAFLSLNVEKNALFEIGIIAQSNGWKSFLSNKTSFPGSSQRVYIEKESYLFALQFEQFLLEVSSEAANYRPAHETFFFSQRVDAKYRVLNRFDIGTQFGLFNFSEFSSLMAHKSDFLGNTTIGEGEHNSRFRYDFKGYFGNLFVESNNMIKNLNSKFSMLFLKNTEAVLNRNLIARFVLHQEVYSDSNLTLSVFTELFRYESDAFPAYYASKNYGFLNRKGCKIGVALAINNNLKITGEYVMAKPIMKNIIQTKLDSFYISLEKSDVF